MRFVKSILFLMVGILATEVHAVEADAGKLQAEALLLLQKNEKTKALKLLELAFEKTANAEELREISVLILEASPSNYPKREAYLQYLIKFNGEHPDAWMWFKEMGDRSFDRAKLDESEDWYLRALPNAKDPALIRYKLAWVFWNLKRKVEAFQTFVEIYPQVESGLQAQIIKDMAKLWWEIGALPTSTFDNAMNLSDEARKALLTRLFDAPPATIDPGPQLAAQLLQLKEDPRTKEFYSEGILKILKIKNAPCFAFNVLLTSEDQFSKDQLLLCLKSKERPSADKMIPFVEKLLPENDEKVDWAYSELLIETNRFNDAIDYVLKADKISNRSKEYLEYIEQLLLKQDKEVFQKTYDHAGPEVFEILLKMKPNAILLDRLQAIDFGPWLNFEEQSFSGKPVSKAFLIKKAVWIEQTPHHVDDDLIHLFHELTKPPLSGDERKALEGFHRLQAKVKTKLPSKFSMDFKKKFDAWVKALDKDLESLKTLPPQLQILARPVYQGELKKNIESLEAQIDASELDSKLEELREGFEQKKSELKADLRAKYLNILEGVTP